ncbi:MAG: NHL repeat-containing protein [Solirubrobacterales bacterium]
MNTPPGETRPHRRSLLLALAAGALFLLSLASATPAAAELTVCSGTGSGAGQCSSPQGVAVDQASGSLYVADRNNNRINVFEADDRAFLFAFGWDVIPSGGAGDTGTGLEKCTTASGCKAGVEGSGAGQLSKPTRIAIDNTGGANQGDIYVTDENPRVQKFGSSGAFELSFGIQGKGECQISGGGRAIAVGPGGNVFLADAAKVGSSEAEGFNSRVEKFSPAGACLGETKLFGPANQVIRDLAIDSSEDAYVSAEGAGELRKYDLAVPETQLCVLDSGIETTALAVDGAGHLFAAQREVRDKAIGSFRVITEYDSACNKLRRFGYGELEGSIAGLTLYPSPEGDVFASGEGNGVKYLKFPPPGPIVASPTLEASPVKSVWAAIKAEINPEGKATTYRVDYVEEDSFETEGEWGSPKVRTSGELSLGASDFLLHGAEAIAGCKPFTEQALGEGKCLKPATTYRYRVVAKNADGEDEAEGELTTRPPMDFEETYATEVGIDSATLNVLFNPLGSEATGYFQYVEEAAYLKDKGEGGDGFAEAIALPDVPGGQAPLDFGAGEEGLRQSATAFPLSAGTTYRYRLIATDPFATLAGPAGAFTTFAQPEAGTCPANEAFRTGAATFLPDCRAYELVSPLDKDNGDIVGLPANLTAEPAVLNKSAVSGERLAYGSYRAFGDAKSAPFTAQYIAARVAGKEWASHSIVSPKGHLLNDSVTFETEFRAFSDDLCEAWQTPFSDPPLSGDAIGGYMNLYRRTDELCGGAPDYEALTTAKPPNHIALKYAVELQGISADGSVAAFRAKDSLADSGAPAQPAGCATNFSVCRHYLYAKGPGTGPRFVCVLPGGTPTTAPDCTAGTGMLLAAGETQKQNVANALSDDGSSVFWSASTGNGTGQIYMRENPLGEGTECVDVGAPCTIAVSEEGEALTPGSGTSRFWAAAADGSVAIFTTDSDLYEFEVVTQTTEKLAGSVLGVMGASEDSGRVYFASREAIAGSGQNSFGEEASAGKPNLYLYESGTGSYRFIATVTEADVDDGPQVGTSATAVAPWQRSSRVSEDGLHAAFMSAALLGGYDNTDASSPEECGKPKGICDTEVYRYAADTEALNCVSCNPSGARPVGTDIGGKGGPFWVAAKLPVFQNTLYAARVLSADGSRLYFESADALVPRDTNGRFDVYQWEEPGRGGCAKTTPTFSPPAGGCIDLISSGQSKRDSGFIDASPSGEDVFIATLASLQPYDPGLVDIYDARAGGGLPAPPPPPAGCEGEACQGAQQPPIDQTPASASFRGAGNATKAKPRPRCPKGKRRVKRRGKVRCIKPRTPHRKGRRAR